MDQDAICAFDTLYTNHQIQMLKLAMPLLPSVYRSFLAIYIKFLELQYTMNVAKDICFHAASGNASENHSMDFKSLEQYFESITPYLSADECERFHKIKNMIQTMEQFKQMKPILEMMSQTQDGRQSDDNSYMDILKGFLSEDQVAMFEMFNSAK